MVLGQEFFLNQCITEPTRLNNILDLFFTNNEEFILKIQIEAPTKMSDHKLQCITTGFLGVDSEEVVELDKKSLLSLNFTDNMINWDKLNEDIMTTRWTEKFDGKSASQMYEILMDTLFTVCSKEVPVKTVNRKQNIPRDRRRLMRKRCRLRKKLPVASVTKQNQLEREMQQIESELLTSHQREEERNEEKAVANIKENPKYFYKYARNKSETKTSIGPFIIDGKLVYEGREKANILQEQYASVYSSRGYHLKLREEQSKRSHRLFGKEIW